MNVFNDIIDTLRVSGTLYFSMEFAAPWSVLVPDNGNLARFHLVAGRHFRVHIEGVTELTASSSCRQETDRVPDGMAHDQSRVMVAREQ